MILTYIKLKLYSIVKFSHQNGMNMICNCKMPRKLQMEKHDWERNNNILEKSRKTQWIRQRCREIFLSCMQFMPLVYGKRKSKWSKSKQANTIQ